MNIDAINEISKALNKKSDVSEDCISINGLLFKEHTLIFTVPDDFWHCDWPRKINFVLQKMIAMDKERKKTTQKIIREDV